MSSSTENRLLKGEVEEPSSRRLRTANERKCTERYQSSPHIGKTKMGKPTAAMMNVKHPKKYESTLESIRKRSSSWSELDDENERAVKKSRKRTPYSLTKAVKHPKKYDWTREPVRERSPSWSELDDENERAVKKSPKMTPYSLTKAASRTKKYDWTREPVPERSPSWSDFDDGNERAVKKSRKITTYALTHDVERSQVEDDNFTTTQYIQAIEQDFRDFDPPLTEEITGPQPKFNDENGQDIVSVEITKRKHMCEKFRKYCLQTMMKRCDDLKMITAETALAIECTDTHHTPNYVRTTCDHIANLYTYFYGRGIQFENLNKALAERRSHF